MGVIDGDSAGEARVIFFDEVMVAQVKDAATVLILREVEASTGQDPFEVFMLRRHGAHEFMANAWVFPGGRLEARDQSQEVFGFVDGLDGALARQRLGGEIEEEKALGLYVAAVRETFEEAGLLLARRPGEEGLIDLEAPALRTRVELLRKQVDDKEIGMAEVCRQLGVVLCGEEFGYYAHWVTPDFESRRYDTRFFITRAPRRQLASNDAGETVDEAWWTVTQILEAGMRSEILLAPPTIRTLEDLRAYSSVEEALAASKQRVPPRILPELVEGADEVTLLLPGDSVEKMVLQDGVWRSMGGSA